MAPTFVGEADRQVQVWGTKICGVGVHSAVIEAVPREHHQCGDRWCAPRLWRRNGQREKSWVQHSVSFASRPEVGKFGHAGRHRFIAPA